MEGILRGEGDCAEQAEKWGTHKETAQGRNEAE